MVLAVGLKLPCADLFRIWGLSYSPAGRVGGCFTLGVLSRLFLCVS
jgi:hypothetical protein